MLIVDESYTTKKDIQLLQDVKVKFVSLVQHGANREPFKIIKSEEEGGAMAIIQSILLPLEKSLEELQEQEGLNWLAQAKASKRIKHDGYQELEQAPQSAFSDLSEPIPLPGAPGVSLILGTLKKEKDDLNVTVDLLQAPPSLFATPVATETMTYAISAGDYFFKEMDAFEKSVSGAMSQIGLAPADRTQQIMTAYKALGSFLEPWIAKVVALPDLSAVKSAFENHVEKNTGGLEDMTKDELLAVLKEQNDASQAKLDAQFGALSERLEKLEKSQIAPAEPPEKQPMTIDDAVKLFNEKIDALAAKVEKKQKTDDATAAATPVTEPKSTGADEPEPKTEPAVKDDGKGLPADKRAGIFAGTVFDHKKLKAAGLVI